MGGNCRQARRQSSWGAVWSFVLILSLCQAGVVLAADEVTVKGTVLRGTIVSANDAKIELETEYGTGKISIAFEDIQDIKTDSRFIVLYGDKGEASGRIVGFKDGRLLVGTDPATATPVAVAGINRVHPAATYETSVLGPLRSEFAYWRGSFDLGFGLTQSTVDSSTFFTGFRADRIEKPTRLMLQAAYRYGTEKARGSDSTTVQDNIRGLVRGEYDLTRRLLAFGAADAEYDAIQDLSVRAVPKAGLGYKLYETKTDFFQVEGGGAYVYQRYFGGDTEDYFAIAFGAATGLTLPYGARFEARADYLPAIDDWMNTYLLRGEAALIVPMIRALSFKASVVNVYNNAPAADTDRNSLATLVGLTTEF